MFSTTNSDRKLFQRTLFEYFIKYITYILDIVQWPTTRPGTIRPHPLTDGLGLCFSVFFWHLSQQDVRLKNSHGENLLALRMTFSTYSGFCMLK
jgi:hypothetical protein